MAKKTLVIPGADGRLRGVDEGEWRRRDLERRHGPLFRALSSEHRAEDSDTEALKSPAVARAYGAMLPLDV